MLENLREGLGIGSIIIEPTLAVQVAERFLFIFFFSKSNQEILRGEVEAVGGLRHALVFVG